MTTIDCGLHIMTEYFKIECY